MEIINYKLQATNCTGKRDRRGDHRSSVDSNRTCDLPLSLRNQFANWLWQSFVQGRFLRFTRQCALLIGMTLRLNLMTLPPRGAFFVSPVGDRFPIPLAVRLHGSPSGSAVSRLRDSSPSAHSCSYLVCGRAMRPYGYLGLC